MYYKAIVSWKYQLKTENNAKFQQEIEGYEINSQIVNSEYVTEVYCLYINIV